MYTGYLLLVPAIALALAGSALAEEKTKYESEVKIGQDSKGNYERKTSEERKDATGKSSTETTVDVDVEGDGDTEKTVTTKAVNDPKGLMNKTTTKTKDKITQEDGKITQEHKKTVNGRTVEEDKKSY